MRHARKHRTDLFVEDPETGNRYPIPQGGAEDADGADATAVADGDGDDDAGASDDDDAAADGDSGDEDTDQLGDAGKKALDRMKAERKQLRAERKQLREELAAAKAAATNDDEPDAAAIQAEAEARANARANERIVRSEVKAAAAGKLADPGDAYKFLDLNEFEVDEEGNVDEDEIADAIADLIERKPYLAVQDGKRFQGKADGGTRNGGKPAQLAREDLRGMSPEAIAQAKKDGRLDKALGRT